jgi:hypothetical protein
MELNLYSSLHVFMPWTEIILTLLLLDIFSLQFCLLLGTCLVNSFAVLLYHVVSFSVVQSVM